MRFVALVSGGKDSCFNILHCLKQGHDLVAIANLYPNDESKQELDSYMFQTVGHDVVSYYDMCAGVPIFRHQISPGGSKNLDMNYTVTADDEIEDLYALLSEVKDAIPELEAVSVGAILSSYQRTRVEDVCRRLQLTVLSYLWQRDQLELMTEMCSVSKNSDTESDGGCGMDARIIKVAAVGLDQSHLGLSLPQIFGTMKKLNRMYDVHICGEGGEFETMVLDAPFFANGRLNVVSKLVDLSDENNGVYSVQFKVEFEKRKSTNAELDSYLSRLPVPPLLNDKWSALLKKAESIKPSEGKYERYGENNFNSSSIPKLSIAQVGDLLYISNLRAESSSAPVEIQAREVFAILDVLLRDRDLSPCQAINCSLILGSMSHFATVNDIYNQFFDISRYGPLPPSRACVESSIIGKDSLIQLSLVLDMKSKPTKLGQELIVNKNKNGLHVQGRSYWAPCNIGPYSQAIWLNSDKNKVSYVSGQIALNPSSMEMLDLNPSQQAAVSLRHFDVLKNSIEARKQLFMTCFVVDHSMVFTAAKIWSLYCNEMQYESELWMDKDQDPLECLILVKVSGLPRNALCEWAGVACQELDVEILSDDDEEVGEVASEAYRGITLKEQSSIFFSEITITNGSKKQRFVTGYANTSSEILMAFDSITHPYKLTLYYSPLALPSIPDDLKTIASVEFIPVDRVYDYNGNTHKVGFHLVM